MKLKICDNKTCEWYRIGIINNCMIGDDIEKCKKVKMVEVDMKTYYQEEWGGNDNTEQNKLRLSSAYLPP